MWISKTKKWTKTTLPLERFLAEKILQRCDYDEILSNQHRTTNGYTQIMELLNLCILSTTRARTLRTVRVLFEEAKSPLFSQNIVNDFIIKKYFSDIKEFIKSYDTAKLFNKENNPELSELNRLIYKLKIFESQLEKGYFICLKKEFFNVDYKSEEKVFAKTNRITTLVDILIPYLVFKGYAVSSLSDILLSWIDKKYHITPKRLFISFNFEVRTLDYLIKVNDPENDEFKSFIDFLQHMEISNIKKGIVSSLKGEHEAIEIFDDKQYIILYKSASLDPHNHFRYIYDTLLKRIVQTKERPSLSPFNNFFSNCFWRLPKKGKNYHNVSLVNDPINVNYRARTLRDTLSGCAKDFKFEFDSNSLIPIPFDPQINSSLYYYNLALGSKSIENSLSLLWTSLESLLPYRVFYSDIECLQHFVSKSLCLGAVSRDVFGFLKRLQMTKIFNGSAFKDIELPDIEDANLSKSITSVYNWITDLQNHDKKFASVKKESELLAHEYAKIGLPLTEGKFEDLAKRINTSQQSISFQVQRVYLHRNQIIHAGNLVNEYTNLWMHLEWYIGKLLAYSIIQMEITQNKKTLKDVFTELEADYEYVISYLEKNKKEPITNISSRVKEILLNYHWQSF